MIIKTNLRRFDFGMITSVEKTPQGFLKVPGFATRCGVFPYIDAEGKVRRELRHPDDVFAPESLASLKNAVVTLEHPPVMVEPSNFAEYSVGYTTDRVDVNRDLVEVDLIIANADAVNAVENNGLRELSAGYVADLDEEGGDYNGAAYDFRQRNIRYNHVALVKRGRAGPEVRLRMDSADAAMQDTSMDLKKVIISGEEVELPAHLAAVVQEMLDRYDEMRGNLLKMGESVAKKDEEMKKDVDVAQKGIDTKVPEVQMVPDGKSAGKKVDAEKEEEKKDEDEEKKDAEEEKKMDAVSDLKEKLDAMQAKLDELMAGPGDKKKDAEEEEEKKDAEEEKEKKMDAAHIRTAVKARVRLEREAEKVLPAKQTEKFDSMSDDEIRSAVIKHRHPKAELSGKSSIYLQSRFDSIVETFEESATLRKTAGAALLERMDSDTDPNSARTRMSQATKSLWQSNLSASKK